ncbi:MAG: cyclic nucleotide-binding domain-containing protein [Proteobacteria bacterium]|nr:cyclic nucleotide-binding domain-containing protein [Pseudomonadota bacterium]
MEPVLKKSPLFSGLDEREITELEAISTSKRYPKGALIFSEDEEAKGFFVVISGKVKIYKLSPEGKEQILHIISPGQTFAEAALFGDSTYPAFAESLVETRVRYFPKESFVNLIRKNPQISLNMIASLSHWLRKFVALVEELSLKDVSARLSKYLINLSIQSGRSSDRGIEFELDINKSQLASQLGTISETLSRALRKLRDRKIIEVEGKKITILQKDLLEDISSGIPL